LIARLMRYVQHAAHSARQTRLAASSPAHYGVGIGYSPAKPHCKAEIEAEVKKAYPNHDKDNRSMNGEGRPPSDKAKAHLDSGGNAGNQGSKGTIGRQKK
jgi:hypothetical protein